MTRALNSIEEMDDVRAKGMYREAWSGRIHRRSWNTSGEDWARQRQTPCSGAMKRTPVTEERRG